MIDDSRTAGKQLYAICSYFVRYSINSWIAGGVPDNR